MPFVQNTGLMNSGRLQSGFWSDCPWDAIKAGHTNGFTLFDDFTGPAHIQVTATAGTLGSWSTFYDTGCTIVPSTTEQGGVLTGTIDTADDDLILLSQTGGVLISTATRPMWFEARVKVSSITDTSCGGLFVGLIDTGLTPAAAIPLADDGSITNTYNLLGFWRREADGNMFDLVHQANGVALAVAEADSITLAVDTYYKVGMKWDPAAGYLNFYKDGTIVYQLASASVGAAASPTNFPNDVILAPIWAMHGGAGVAGTTSLDWIRVAQLY